DFLSIKIIGDNYFVNFVDINNDGYKDFFSGTTFGGIIYWEHSGFTVNPVLSWSGATGFETDGVNPDSSGYPNSFEFRVIYTQADNEPPYAGYPKVHILKGGTEIPGSPFTMTETNSGDTTYSDGKEYTYTYINLDCGLDYSYYFECKDDDWGAPATGDPVTAKDSPDVLCDISGTVTEKGKPLSGVTITLSGDGSDEFVTADDGQYSFNDLNGGSTYIITPSKDNYIFKPESVTVVNFQEHQTIDFTGKKIFAEDLSNVKVYPNPYKPGQGVDYIVFDNLTRNAKIMIYTIQGDLILTAYPDLMEYHWFLKNEAGISIASGVYLYVITDTAGDEKKGKIAVIK
ncbi:MAG: T9SS type A sorting domain-containing protein, partial [bacterium]|nr:T9SS type A sorting domain-containing protein [bacterium]